MPDAFFPHRACAALVLLSVVAVVRADCNGTLSGLTTCAVLNGVPAIGELTAAEIELAKSSLEGNIRQLWNSTPTLHTVPACKPAFETFSCVLLSSPLAVLSCNGTATPLHPCYDWCIEYMTTCMPGLPPVDMAASCLSVSPPSADAKCFGSNGVLGMKPKPATPAPSPRPPLVLYFGQYGLPETSTASARLSGGLLFVSLVSIIY